MAAMAMDSSLERDVEHDGFAVVPGVLATSAVADLIAVIGAAGIARAERRGSIYGGRNLLDLALVREHAHSRALMSFVAPVLGPEPKPVRALYFDKNPQANWPVLWHQDLSIAVAEKHELDGWGPWSTKAGIHHVQPPAAVLERMLAVRLHLDDCGPDNGPLRVLPGTHRRGKIPRAEIQRLRGELDEAVCLAAKGDAVLMRPLLLHASSPAHAASHRRVVHIEYAARHALPQPFQWHALAQP